MTEFLETTIDKFVFKVATDRLYSAEGVWLLEQGGRVRLGISDYQQQRSGDVAFAHLKPAGTDLAALSEFAEIETIKATVSLACPIQGRIAEVNAALDLSPERINEEPYGKGWLVVLEPNAWQADRCRLLTADAYLTTMRVQAEEELKS
jgi:glycine cleavage system H protein